MDQTPQSPQVPPVSTSNLGQPPIMPNIPTSSPSPAKPHSNTPLIIILVILALAGIGGSIWGIISTLNNKSEISALKADVENKSNTISKVEEALGIELEKTQGNNDNSGDSSTELPSISQPNKSDSKYIYVGEWGIKIKIPENLSYVGYEYTPKTDDITADAICVTGAKQGGGSGVPEFVVGNASNYYAMPRLGCLSRYASPDQIPIASGPSETLEIGGYTYGYTGPQAVVTTIQDEVQWELDSVAIIQEMLTKNLSEF